MSKVVYLEDDQGMREIIQELLKDEFDIITTISPDLVLDLCENDDVGVVLADHHMDTIQGVEFLNQLYERYPAIRRVLITGDRSTSLMMEAINTSHIHGIFHKPLDFMAFKHEIKELQKKFAELKRTEQQRQILLKEVTELRTRLYQQNTKIFDMLNSLKDDKTITINKKNPADVFK